MEPKRVRALDKLSDTEVGDSAKDHLRYVRLRSPATDGQTLDVPSGESLNHQFRDNVRQMNERGVANGLSPSRSFVDQWRATARREVVDRAIGYTSRYLPEAADVLRSRLAVGSPQILFAGHQPTLFHPGVWYKNFRLDELSQEFEAIGINMVVDNDLAGSAAIKVPSVAECSAKLQLLEMDAPDHVIPWEMRPIVDRQVFESFAGRTAAAIKPMVDQPLVEPLWRQTLTADQRLHQFANENQHRASPGLGHIVAAGRHRLEWQHGLRTLEIPVSQIAQSESFAAFAQYVLENVETFQQVYNSVLMRYRQRHRIRSSAHPVPELELSDGWNEVPFWIWSSDSPVRRRLFVRQEGGCFQITDRANAHHCIGRNNLAQWMMEQSESSASGPRVFIRPRALMTTMYSRLLASDMFIHGIGGAKYDQLTDQIIAEFFQVPAPAYLTSTATFELPTECSRISSQDITDLKNRLREIRFHPETFIGNPDAESNRLVQQKQQLIREVELARLQPDRDPVADSDRHQQIERINGLLEARIADVAAATREKIGLLQARLRDSQILHSREFSFALHPKSLVKRMFQTRDNA